MLSIADPSHEALSIRPCTLTDAALLAKLGTETFISSHGHSASPEDIDAYVKQAFTVERLKEELSEERNIFFLLSLKGQAVGYSKFIFNTRVTADGEAAYCKLERIYLLAANHGHGLGKVLLDHAIGLAKVNSQQGMWLHVWEENLQAIKFYQRYCFQISGAFDFRISVTHVNPNHQMLLEW